MIDAMFNQGALPVVERLVQFTGQRHRVLVDNIANVSTPYYKPADLDPKAFQSALREAVDQRRVGGNPAGTALRMSDTQQIRFGKDRIEVRPEATHEGVLYHDQNNRDLERIMQNLAENTMAHNLGIELLRGELATLRTAIRERL